MKRLSIIVLALSLCLPATAQELKKSVTWENIKAHPAPLPVIGELPALLERLHIVSFELCSNSFPEGWKVMECAIP